MNIVAPTCPYCNAPASIPSGTQAGQRIDCGRCGESFSLRPGQTGIAAAMDAGTAKSTAITETAHAPVVPLPARPRRPLLTPEQKRRNRIAAVVILGAMVLMASLGLIYALKTEGARRENDTALKKRPMRSFFKQNEPEEAPVPPAQLDVLGYLPEGAHLLVGVNLAELRRDRAGKALLEQPLKIAEHEFKIREIAGWGGLPADAIDHLVLALLPPDEIQFLAKIPSGVLLLRTHKPYEVDQVRSALKAQRAPGADRKDVYQFPLANTSYRLVVWCIDDRTLALALFLSHLETMPAKPREGLTHLAPGLPTILEKQIDSGASVWAAGVFDDKTRAQLKDLPLLKGDSLNWLGTLRGLGAWVQVQEQVRMGVALHLSDDAAARKQEQAWQPRPEEVNPALKTARDGSWLLLQYRTTLEEVLGALRK